VTVVAFRIERLEPMFPADAANPIVDSEFDRLTYPHLSVLRIRREHIADLRFLGRRHGSRVQALMRELDPRRAQKCHGLSRERRDHQRRTAKYRQPDDAQFPSPYASSRLVIRPRFFRPGSSRYRARQGHRLHELPAPRSL
jgi:hypothetical protein